MAKKYDFIIIGAGPAGLTAAKTAAEKGLSVVLVEAKKDITKITRTCSQQFGFSHIFGQSYTKPIRVEIESGKKAKLVFPDINLSVEYGGMLRACYDWRNLSPNGNCVYTLKNTLWSFIFNKEILLKGLLEEVMRLGVTMRSETRGLNVENMSDGVRVQIKNSKGKTSFLKAKKAIVADGVNSRIVENLGLNKTRQTIGTTLRGIGYVMEGVECPYPTSSWISFAYPSVNAYFNLWMGPMAEGTWQIGTTAKAPDSPREIINQFLSNSHFSSWFKNIKIAKKSGFSLIPRYPLTEPVAGNIVIIGDAAAPAETWVVGAMASGYQAVNNILEEEMKKYIEWWKESFWFNSPDYFKDFARYPAISMLFKDNELNYLYGLIKDKVVVSIHEELINCADQVRGAKPRIYKKLKKLQEFSIEDTFKSKS
jgi:digeranylgeranylglycerophospholipid reductase